MKQHIVILAGGKGSRMNNPRSKQFLELEGQPVLMHTVAAFVQALPDARLIIVLPEDERELGRQLLFEKYSGHDIVFCTGGATRFDSVKCGLKCIDDPDTSVVMVHDAARCLITADLIMRCFHQAISKGSAIPAIPCTDSVRWMDEHGNKAVDRTHLYLVQTPQAFHSNIILPAFAQAVYQPSFTDEAAVVEANGLKVELIEGEKTNIKITHPLDLALAAGILRERKQS